MAAGEAVVYIATRMQLFWGWMTFGLVSIGVVPLCEMGIRQPRKYSMLQFAVF